MINPIYQEGEELLLNPLGSKYLVASAHTYVNSSEFVVQEDSIISVLTGGDSSVAANDIDYKTSMGLSGVTLKQGALIVAPRGESFQSITIDSGSIMAYNSISGGVKPSGSVPLLLDTYPDASAAYSLRKLRNDYAGDAIEVRIDTATTPQPSYNIGFDSDGNLDTADLLSKAGSNDAYVAVWYDQSGNANNATQVSATLQPQIVELGVVVTDNGLPTVNFTNTTGDDGLEIGSRVTVKSAFIPYNLNNTSLINYAIGDDSSFTGGTAKGLILGGTYLPAKGLSVFEGTVIALDNPEIFGTMQLATYLQDGANTFLSNNGGALTNISSQAALTVKMLGSRRNDFQTADSKIGEFILYPTDQSSNRIAIENNINTNYNIYWDGSQTGLLDDYPNASAAYSLRALNSAYTGAAIKVRRSSDNAEQDINLLYDGSLNTSALLSFVGSGDGFVSSWYDQSGNNNNATQIAEAQQPKIVSSGVIELNNGKACCKFDGVNDTLIFNQQNVYSSFSVENAVLTGGFGTLGNTSNSNIIGDLNSTTARIRLNNTNYQFNVANPENSLTVLNRNINNYSLFVNNTSSSNNPISIPFDMTLNAMMNRENTFFYEGFLQESILYPYDQSSDRVAIETNINTYYTIY